MVAYAGLAIKDEDEAVQLILKWVLNEMSLWNRAVVRVQTTTKVAKNVLCIKKRAKRSIYESLAVKRQLLWNSTRVAFIYIVWVENGRDNN